MKKYSVMIIIAVVLLAVIIAGLWVAGSPRQARLERFDAERRNDIATLQNHLQEYWYERGTLPMTLAEVTSTQPYILLPVDPDTRQPYEYIRMNSSTFSLCAVFATEEKNGQSAQRYFPDFSTSEEFLRHGVGRTCFEKTATERRGED